MARPRPNWSRLPAAFETDRTLLLELIAGLQAMATVSMIDVCAYARWLTDEPRPLEGHGDEALGLWAAGPVKPVASWRRLRPTSRDPSIQVNNRL